MTATAAPAQRLWPPRPGVAPAAAFAAWVRSLIGVSPTPMEALAQLSRATGWRHVQVWRRLEQSWRLALAVDPSATLISPDVTDALVSAPDPVMSDSGASWLTFPFPTLTGDAAVLVAEVADFPDVDPDDLLTRLQAALSPLGPILLGGLADHPGWLAAAVQQSQDGLLLAVHPSGVVTDALGALSDATAAEFVGHPLSRWLEQDPATAHLTVPILGDGEPAIVTPRNHPHLRWRVVSCPVTGVVPSWVTRVTDVTDEQRVWKRLTHDAHHDPLTGLLNRVTVMRQLTDLIADPERPMALVFVDLNQFKKVNDTVGHMAADEVLAKVAQRMKEVLPPTDLIARFGGDEFVAVCLDVVDATDAHARAHRIHSAATSTVTTTAGDVTLTASAGVTLRSDVDSPEPLVWQADVAMTEAKRAGGGVSVFTPALMVRVRDAAQLDRDLRDAVDAEAFTLLFQPIISLESGAVESVEALLRWPHPTRGILEPSVFIPLAENAGVIHLLGDFVLREAVAQWAQWRHDLGGIHPPRVAVNVSPAQMADDTFPQRVRAALADCNVPGVALTLEITESMWLGHPGTAAALLEELHHLGVQIHIDDFGTGYSNLGQLAGLPADALKIDKSFLWKIGSDDRVDATVDVILQLARRLNMHVVAEGIETDAHLAWAKANNCQFGQGYALGRPQPAAQVLTLLSAEAQRAEN